MIIDLLLSARVEYAGEQTNRPTKGDMEKKRTAAYLGSMRNQTHRTVCDANTCRR